MSKIVVGKPATINDADAASYMPPPVLGSAILSEYQYNKWKTGVMLYQYSSDPSGTILANVLSPLYMAYSNP